MERGDTSLVERVEQVSRRGIWSVAHSASLLQLLVLTPTIVANFLCVLYSSTLKVDPYRSVASAGRSPSLLAVAKRNLHQTENASD